MQQTGALFDITLQLNRKYTAGVRVIHVRIARVILLYIVIIFITLIECRGDYNVLFCTKIKFIVFITINVT